MARIINLKTGRLVDPELLRQHLNLTKKLQQHAEQFHKTRQELFQLHRGQPPGGRKK